MNSAKKWIDFVRVCLQGRSNLNERKRSYCAICRHPPLNVLDIGGGPGGYAAWLADLGYNVQLIDPIPLHVEQARAADPRIVADVGDARQLTQADASMDAVLLMGPLYHLIDVQERLSALLEARRVLRREGWLFAAAISRYAALLDLFLRIGRLYEPEVLRIVTESVESGIFRGAVNDLFTTAYLHLPEEFAKEITDAGFTLSAVLNIEGPGFLLRDFVSDWSDPVKREAILQLARLIEARPELLAASGHILGVAQVG